MQHAETLDSSSHTSIAHAACSLLRGRQLGAEGAVRAAQVVAVLNGAGAILGIEEDLLGATVLAWGETLPDLVAMLAVARAGGHLLGGPVDVASDLPTASEHEWLHDRQLFGCCHMVRRSEACTLEQILCLVSQARAPWRSPRALAGRC
jgi:Sodium/calcium exchanger protein